MGSHKQEEELPMKMSFRRQLVLLAMVLLVASPLALASGFHVFEQDVLVHAVLVRHARARSSSRRPA